MPNFLDPPGRRLAYDSDGSVMTIYRLSAGTITEESVANKKTYNDESTGYVVHSGYYGTTHFGLYFPGPRDITDIYLGFNPTSYGYTAPSFDWSSTSTNPLDGTWTNVAFNGLSTSGSPNPEYRSPTGWVASGVRAIRFVTGATGGNGQQIWLTSFHVYGTRAAGDTSRQVAFVDLAGNRFAKDFDFQDRPRGSTYKWKAGTLYNQSSELYVKNFSATETANNVIVGQEALTGAMHNNIRISTDDVTYAQTKTFTSIAPGAVAGPIFVRWTPPAGDTLGVQTMRTPVTVGSWT